MASLVGMGLLKCIGRFEEEKTKEYIAHWKKHARLAVMMAHSAVCLLIHSFVPALCKPLEEATCNNSINISQQ